MKSGLAIVTNQENRSTSNHVDLASLEFQVCLMSEAPFQVLLNFLGHTGIQRGKNVHGILNAHCYQVCFN